MSENIETISQLVASNESAFRDLIDQKLQIYEQQQLRTREHKIPVLAFCGYGRAGKDLAAAWLSQNYPAVRYVGSISHAVAPLVAIACGTTTEEAFATRHNNREFWFRFCNCLRRSDPTLLGKLTLAENDVLAGIRSDTELEALRSSGVVDLTIWVENPRVKFDTTVEYTYADCDISIVNDGTKHTYFTKLRSLARMLGIPTFSH